MGFFLKTAFRSGRFRFGFCTLSAVLLFILVYSIISGVDPMAMNGVMFEKPNLIEYIRGDIDAGPAAQTEEDIEAAKLMAQFGLSGAVQKEAPKVLRILGTDNFGRDMLAQLVAGTKTSLLIGIIAGCIATFIGLTIGLVAGYKGGNVDNFLASIINVMIVIPNFVILVLISVSIRTRSFLTTALIIGITAWPWTARSVRAQTTSLRNRDHVNLSKLSGHSMPRIIVRDIVPYIASYVTTAFITQLASGILAEASLSMLGLGPHNVASLGLLMSWSMTFSALPNGAWWAFVPVVAMIAIITFSMRVMNSGLDQIYNPQIRS